MRIQRGRVFVTSLHLAQRHRLVLLAAVAFPALGLSGCRTVSDETIKLVYEDHATGTYHLREQEWLPIAETKGEAEVYRKFGSAVMNLADARKEARSIAPCFRELGLFLEKQFGRESPRSFLVAFERSIEKYEHSEDQSRQTPWDADRPGARIQEYRKSERSRVALVLRSASWALRAEIHRPRCCPVPSEGREGPEIVVQAPREDQVFFQESRKIEILGSIRSREANAIRSATIYVDEGEVSRGRGLSIEPAPRSPNLTEFVLGRDGEFRAKVEAGEGPHHLAVVARDNRGNTGKKEIGFCIQHPQRLTALVIGINDYADDSVPDLEFCEADAEAIDRHLRENLQTPAGNVRPLLGKKATLREIEDAVEQIGEDFQDPTDEHGVFVMYFSGHGVLSDAGGDQQVYLLPSDAKLDDLPQSAISNERLADWLVNRIRSRTVVIIVDACYSGTLTLRESLSRGWLDARPHVLLSSCQKDQRARESRELRHGIFTSACLRGLRKAGDLNHDGLVSVLELTEVLQRTWQGGQEPILEARVEHPVLLGVVASTEIGGVQ